MALLEVGLFHSVTVTIENQRQVGYSIKERRMVEHKKKNFYFMKFKFLVIAFVLYCIVLIYITMADYREIYPWLMEAQIYFLWVIWLVVYFMMKIFSPTKQKSDEEKKEQDLDPRIREARDNFEDYHLDSNFRNRYLESLKKQITADNRHLKPKAVELHQMIVDKFQYEYINEPIKNNVDIFEAEKRARENLKKGIKGSNEGLNKAAGAQNGIDLLSQIKKAAEEEKTKNNKKKAENTPKSSSRENAAPSFLGGLLLSTRRNNKQADDESSNGSSKNLLAVLMGFEEDDDEEKEKDIKKEISITQFVRGALFILFPLTIHTLYLYFQVIYSSIVSIPLWVGVFTVFFGLPFVATLAISKLNQLYGFQHSMYIILSLETIQFLHLNLLFRVPDDINFPDLLFYIIYIMVILATRMVFNVPSIRLWIFLRNPLKRKKLGYETDEDQKLKVKEFLTKLIALNFGLGYIFIYIFTSFNMLGSVLIAHFMGFVNKLEFLSLHRNESIAYFIILFILLLILFVSNGRWIRKNVKDINIDESSVIFLNHYHYMYTYITFWFLLGFVNI